MIDFSKFGFTIKEQDETYIEYENDILTIQHWKKPNIFIVAIIREKLILLKDDYDYLDETRKGKIPTNIYKVKRGISESEEKLAKMLMNSNFYTYPLFVGELKDETFFEILINAICTNADKIIQCGS